MRRPHISVLALALLIAVGLVGTLTPADARSKRTCALKNSKTYQKNKSARLFTRKELQDAHPLQSGTYYTALYGCHLRTKKRVFLASRDGYTDGWLVKLQGRFVAVNHTATGPEVLGSPRSGFVRLWDLKRPKRLHNIKDVEATDVDIGPGGQLVFIGRPLAQLGGQEQPLSVRVVDGKGNRTLATGNIAPKSLTVKGLTASWTQDGAPRSAQL